MTVLLLMSHITRGRGYPVTLQQNLAHSPSLTMVASGFETNTGFSFSLASSSFSSATL